MNKRVVITGLGICAPNGVGLEAFTHSLQNGISGIRFQPKLKQLQFSCQVAGEPLIKDNLLQHYFSPLQLRGLNASGLVYGVIAGTDAWNDAGLPIAPKDRPDWDSGIIFGTGILGADKFRESIYAIDEGNVRRLGSTSVMQVMASGISAYLGGILGTGNQVTTNSSACTTGTEGILMAYERIRSGKAKRMLTGSCSDSGPYIWAGFDSMRILPRNYNGNPSKASRPLSASAAGFVPGSGAGALVLESLESARERGANIYAEVLGGAVNSGGQRGEGSMTAPNSESVVRCIRKATEDAGIHVSEIDTINGHLTATRKDPIEIRNWSEALQDTGTDFPFVNSFKGLFGHGLAAAGSMECVASVLQIGKGQVFGNVNCEDLHPEIEEIVHRSKIPLKTILHQPKILAKASFGFGDVNACVIFSQFND
ncbi:beta-ketoacyl-[acyl-carrier-protein] synthase family protein [Flavobacteriaceae bacterium TP-CH-4]|uniref:3-oxoacyl-[acyl-carrier-protein] synthase 1 n=1 Tax=Pelagihabitans pacificus TaxID=2696054 RepID=A0A967B0S1_9FLAO|nr:beta-ketoacyl-[acyl-carrier-protein] synthase family protein [Pelagihabitans pacificus]NHF60011.1 beta-ketoacyl-[acyl-carrier-protein] synthase family protein [Pelagihabitans pacificus]